MSENQISADSMYIERCPNINFSGIVSDTKQIYEIYRILVIHVKPWFRKIQFYNKKWPNPQAWIHPRTLKYKSNITGIFGFDIYNIDGVISICEQSIIASLVDNLKLADQNIKLS